MRKVMRGIDSERAVKFGRVVVVCSTLLVLASCLQRGPSTKAAAPVTPAAPKPVAAAPPPPPPPLSIPQTRVELPAPQPVDAAALETESAPPDAQQPALRPAAGPPRRPAAPPAAVPPATPPAATPEQVEAPIREVIPQAEQDRLREQAKGRRDEVERIFAQLGKRGEARSPKSVVESIKSFLTLSKEAESRNDLRQADALAERAQILARDLLNGK
jgi:hypothetical protein